MKWIYATMVRTKQSDRRQAGANLVKARAEKKARPKKDPKVGVGKVQRSRSGPFTYLYDEERTKLIKSPYLYGVEHPIRFKNIPSQ